MARAAQRLTTAEHGVQALVPYQLRHGGASHDMLTGVRTLEGLKRRGQWQSGNLARRCEKGGRIGQVLSRLDPRLRGHCARCAGRIGAILARASLKWP